MEINQDSIFKKSDDLIEANLGESLALMSIDSGKYFGLNQVAKHIWIALEEEVSLKSLVGQLMEKFEIDEHTCASNCKEFLTELVEKNLATIR